MSQARGTTTARDTMRPTDREQHLRNECGQLTRKVHEMIEQRRQMHADLVGQRDSITDAIAALDKGLLRDAREILVAELARRERTREQRVRPRQLTSKHVIS